jgi:hypothetical protein
MIAAGTRLDFVARGTTEAAQFQLIFSPGMLQAEAARILSERLNVQSVDVFTQDTVITGTLPWTYTANVSLTTRSAHARVEDVASIVANAFSQASGNMPIVTQGHAIDTPNLSWSWIALIAAAGVLVIALKID